MEEYQDYVYSFKIDIKDNEICGQKNFLQLEVFDNPLIDKATETYVPVIGVVSGTINLCYGVRICKNNMFLKIYDDDQQKIYVVFIVGEIATIVKTFSANTKNLSKKLSYFKIVEKEESIYQIDPETLNEILFYYNVEFPQNQMEKRLAYDITNCDFSLPSYALDITNMSKAIYFNLFVNFLVKNNIRDVSILTSNKKVIKMLEKCKNENGSFDVEKVTPLINKIDIVDWFDMAEKIENLLPEYRVFEEFDETAFDLFEYGKSENDSCYELSFL